MLGVSGYEVSKVILFERGGSYVIYSYVIVTQKCCKSTMNQSSPDPFLFSFHFQTVRSFNFPLLCPGCFKVSMCYEDHCFNALLCWSLKENDTC